MAYRELTEAALNWVEELLEKQTQAHARRSLADRFEKCPNSMIEKHLWRRSRDTPWHEQCSYCGAMRDLEL